MKIIYSEVRAELGRILSKLGKAASVLEFLTPFMFMRQGACEVFAGIQMVEERRGGSI